MDPITIALLGTALTGGGAYFSGQSQDDVNNARNAVITQNRAQQAALDAEAKGVTDKSLGRFNNFGATQDADAARLSDFFKTAVTTPNTPNTTIPLPAASSDQVQREIDNKTGIAKDYVSHQADTLGKLRSFGDVLGNISRGQARDTQQVGQIGGFKAGDTAVTNIALDNANRAGNSNALIGNILSGAGKVALTAGLGGAFAPAAGGIAADGSILGAAGPTSVGGAPLVGQTGNIFSTGASPFLSYGR